MASVDQGALRPSFGAGLAATRRSAASSRSMSMTWRIKEPIRYRASCGGRGSLSAKPCVDFKRFVSALVRSDFMGALLGAGSRGDRQSNRGRAPALLSPLALALDRSSLTELLHYCPESGQFTWIKAAARKIKPGDAAGSKGRCGYLRIRLQGAAQQAHRLAWLYMTGSMPPDGMVIDHINGDRLDNRWANLRLVSHPVNMQNQRSARKGTASGLLGVRRQSRGPGWVAAIKVDGKLTHLGSFGTPELAHAAYLEAKRRLHVGCTI